MYRKFIKLFFIGSLVAHCSLDAVFASSQDSWEHRFVIAIQHHPDLIVARQEMLSSLTAAETKDRPLYNPELSTEIEREGDDNNFSIGVSQNIDWWGRQDVVAQQGQQSIVTARYTFEQQLHHSYAEGLIALVNWQGARQMAELAKTQEDQQRKLLRLIEQRQQAGDLGQVDGELAYLGLTGKLGDSAAANVHLRRMEFVVRNLLRGMQAPFSIPDSLWERFDSLQNDAFARDQWIESHPAVLAAKAQWDYQRHSAQLSRLESRADPLIGIGAGRNADDNVVAFTFSMPLNIRNDFSSNIRAAEQRAVSAEASYRAVRQKLQGEMETSRAVMQEYTRGYNEWQGLMLGRGDRSDELLKRLWNSGEISTSEYLTIVQQGTEALTAGFELKKQLNLSRIQWLLNSGQIASFLAPQHNE